MGITPDIWGPSAWKFLHTMVLAESEPLDRSRLIYYKQFYVLLQELLPCEKCKVHLKDNLQKLKDIESLQTRRELFDWTTQLHNLVNVAIHKPEISLDQSYSHWEHVINGGYGSVYFVIGCILIFTLLAVVVLLHRSL
jgi:hypothetical protein